VVVGGRGPLVAPRVGEVVRGCQVIRLGWTSGPVLVLQNRVSQFCIQNYGPLAGLKSAQNLFPIQTSRT
jgi:hypothetical protein